MIERPRKVSVGLLVFVIRLPYALPLGIRILNAGEDKSTTA